MKLWVKVFNYLNVQINKLLINIRSSCSKVLHSALFRSYHIIAFLRFHLLLSYFRSLLVLSHYFPFSHFVYDTIEYIVLAVIKHLYPIYFWTMIVTIVRYFSDFDTCRKDRDVKLLLKWLRWIFTAMCFEEQKS